MSTFSVQNDTCKENEALLRSAVISNEKDRLAKSSPLQNIESIANSNSIKDNVYLCSMRENRVKRRKEVKNE